MDEFKELEFKYSAEKIELDAFIKLMTDWKYSKFLEASSWDIYYLHPDSRTLRFRNSNIQPELTIKRKMTESNNVHRVEVNLPLTIGVRKEIVEAFSTEMGFRFLFKVFKTCFIYWFDEVNIVYYIVYDHMMRERGRFLEIEVNEELSRRGPEEAICILKTWEERISVLGISHLNRIRKSLYEMFKPA